MVPTLKVEPPGPKARKVIGLDDEYLATSTKSLPLVVERAEGSTVWDVDGNSYIDFASGVAVLNIGHCHPAVTKAVCEQINKFSHFAGTDFYYDIQARLAKKLCSISLGDSRKRIFFSNSGTECVEAAMKLARWSTERKQYIAFFGGFHGRTLGALSMTASKTVQQERYFPTTPGVTHVPFANCYRCAYHQEFPSCGILCAKILEEVHFENNLPPEEVAAVFMEPIQGEGGYIVPPKEFVQAIAGICKKHGILFVDDEVQAGMGRTGKMWAMEHYEVVPDVMCTAKALGSGVPFAATIFRSELDWTKKGAHSNTYGGNALACAASLATIDVIEKEKLVEQAASKGEHVKKRLGEMMRDHELIGDVRGHGLMIGVELVRNRETKEYAVKERDELEMLAFKKGLILIGCGRSTLRFIPPLNTSLEQIDAGLDIFEKALVEVGKK